MAKGLPAVNLDNFPPALHAELAGICLQTARGLAKTDQAAAQRALDKAFKLALPRRRRKRTPACGSTCTPSNPTRR